LDANDGAIPDQMRRSATDWLGLALAQAPFAALLFRADDEFTLMWRNAAHERMTGSVGVDMTGLGMFEAFPPSDDKEGTAAMRAIREAVETMRATGEPVNIGPYRYDIREDGGFVEHHWRMQISPVVEGGEIVGFLQVAQDATREVLDARLAATLHRVASTTAGVSQFSFDPATDRFDRTPAVDAMFGFAPDEAGSQAAPFFARVHPEDLPGVRDEVARVFAAPRGEVAAFDYRVPQPDGSERFLRIRAEVAIDPADRCEKLVGTFIDLTDVELNRTQLQRELSLRQSLVEEANHRIKNSLAIALAMLRMEKRSLASLEDVSPNDVLSSLEARIGAISSTHGLMQFDGAQTDVSLRSLLEALVSQTRTSAGLPEQALRLRVMGADRRLDSDAAVSLGIIMNELLTNALKYGMNESGKADIQVAVETSDGDTVIIVANRIEREQPLDAVPSTKLGSLIVRQLVDDLGAELDAKARGDRYSVRLHLPGRDKD
jgi:two-component sensor histidine kinase